MDPNEENSPFPDPNTPECVDEFISAEIPDKPDPSTEHTDPEYHYKLYYYNMVRRQLIHDCEDNPEANCRKDQPGGKCRFGFPFAYADQTTVLNNGRGVTYRRRSPEDGGNFFWKDLPGGRLGRTGGRDDAG